MDSIIRKQPKHKSRAEKVKLYTNHAVLVESFFL